MARATVSAESIDQPAALLVNPSSAKGIQDSSGGRDAGLSSFDPWVPLVSPRTGAVESTSSADRLVGRVGWAR